MLINSNWFDHPLQVPQDFKMAEYCDDLCCLLQEELVVLMERIWLLQPESSVGIDGINLLPDWDVLQPNGKIYKKNAEKY